jgi:23S rRNA (uracil1939-C5)-methyltransferase
MTYDAALDYKRAHVRDCLFRTGIEEFRCADVLPVLGMKSPWHYRNKGAFPVSGTFATPCIGFYAPRSHDVIDVPMGCMVQHPAANAAVAAMRNLMTRYRIAPYHETSRTGSLRHIVTRTALDGRVMMILVSKEPALPAERALAAALRTAVPGLVSLMICHNPAWGNVILNDSLRVLWGDCALEDTLFGLRFRIAPQSFFQVNTLQAGVLIHRALKAASLTGAETVVDAYCGTGAFALPMAQHARRVIGIESVSQSVADAKGNADRNSVTNAEFIRAKTEDALPGLIAAGLTPDVVVLNPPRKGCDAALLASITRAAPRRVVYVSCNPATLARDAASLAQAGYRPVEIQPVDMFCWAGSVETVMTLERMPV